MRTSVLRPGLAKKNIVDASSFAGLLGPTDDTTQKALETIDALVIPGTKTSLDDDAFIGHLSGVTDIQTAADILDKADWRGWTPMPEVYSYLDSDTIALSSSLSNILHDGIPLRLCITSGIVVFSDLAGMLEDNSSIYSITGVSGAIICPSGRLFVQYADDGGGYYHANIYAKWSSGDGYGSLIGHTATYNSTGAKAIIADNDSGISGTITVRAVSGTAEIVEFFIWGTVLSYDDDQIEWRGAVIPDAIEAMWYGDASRCALLRICSIEAIVASVDGILEDEDRPEYWTGPPARSVGACFVARSVTDGGIEAAWEVTDRDGGTVTEGPLSEAASVNATTRIYAIATSGTNRVVMGDKIDITTAQAGGVGSITGMFSEIELVLE